MSEFEEAKEISSKIIDLFDGKPVIVALRATDMALTAIINSAISSEKDLESAKDIVQLLADNIKTHLK